MSNVSGDRSNDMFLAVYTFITEAVKMNGEIYRSRDVWFMRRRYTVVVVPYSGTERVWIVAHGATRSK